MEMKTGNMEDKGIKYVLETCMKNLIDSTGSSILDKTWSF